MSIPNPTIQPGRELWGAHAGSQRAFLASPMYESCYSGTRGPGKTDSLLMKFARHVGQGMGASWRGVIFRKQYKNLDEIKVKGIKLFYPVFPGVKFLKSAAEYKFVWPTGEELLLRQAEVEDDYWNFHGHEYPFVGWDELTSWPEGDLYERMKSVCRSSTRGVPRYYASSTNPYGPGHNWVKAMWWDPAPILSKSGVVIREGGEIRIRFDGDLMENTHLMAADPEYIDRLGRLKNETLKKAWRFGDWEINVGGFFDGYWDPKVHIVDTFTPPLEWPRWRAMDWGFAQPYSIGWYCQDYDKVIYKYRELYGWGGKANVGARHTAKSVAKRIWKLETNERRSKCAFIRNPADHDLWAQRGSEQSPEELMRLEGIRWMKASKGPGSRINGWDVMRTFLEDEAFKVMRCCKHFIRTVPVLMPDEDNIEDVDTDMEDHAADETRYSLTSRHKPKRQPHKAKPIKPKAFDQVAGIKIKKPQPAGIRVVRR